MAKLLTPVDICTIGLLVYVLKKTRLVLKILFYPPPNKAGVFSFETAIEIL